MEIDEHTHQIFLGSIHRLSQVTVQFSEATRPVSLLHNRGHKVRVGYQWVDETFTHTLDETSEHEVLLVKRLSTFSGTDCFE